ncbi:FAD binding domain-containing protein [Variovorax ginsengisoli]|uniref:FAD binding domain-containing protein n=1 Tax=Variovorax ginsengisoli TaxID=363844 RepID=A0ABT8SEX0_9BURK|nr:FAD binding domain-containing protein [Variovorax ginsengisoli]MDN8617372.1 FAD binding domain-containing protein [Variovorax ginsengisoli]MDO1536542.1 FAD binding domain-containing protein [Variovorax ginsengisoli]
MGRIVKAAPFDYVRAESIEHVLELLAQYGMDAKAIAGGQSLVPMMAMRLARPAVLVDINWISDLKQVEIEADRVSMGATTRQRDVEDDAELHVALPLIRRALKWVGHVQTRNRGTIGGSLVHADPSAELPLAAAVLGATLRLQSRDGGERALGAEEFFLGPMFTAVGETECLIDIEWPIWSGPGVVSAFEETAMRSGDFAMGSAACQLQLDAEGVCRRAAIGLGGVDGTPLAFPDLAAELTGRRIDGVLAREVAQAAIARAEPGADLHADVEYRRHLGAVLLARTLQRAASSVNPSVTAH